MIMFPEFYQCHGRSLPIYALKPKGTNIESQFNVIVWILSINMDESQKNLK